MPKDVEKPKKDNRPKSEKLADAIEKKKSEIFNVSKGLEVLKANNDVISSGINPFDIKKEYEDEVGMKDGKMTKKVMPLQTFAKKEQAKLARMEKEGVTGDTLTKQKARVTVSNYMANQDTKRKELERLESAKKAAEKMEAAAPKKLTTDEKYEKLKKLKDERSALDANDPDFLKKNAEKSKEIEKASFALRGSKGYREAERAIRKRKAAEKGTIDMTGITASEDEVMAAMKKSGQQAVPGADKEAVPGKPMEGNVEMQDANNKAAKMGSSIQWAFQSPGEQKAAARKTAEESETTEQTSNLPSAKDQDDAKAKAEKEKAEKEKEKEQETKDEKRNELLSNIDKKMDKLVALSDVSTTAAKNTAANTAATSQEIAGQGKG
jgi:hypothetical protein